jgi:hypothetical protein
MTATTSAATTTATTAVRRRDPYIDALRAGSLLVVVLWHVIGTTLHWSATGPHATTLLGSVPGLWLATWVLQVMPVFFFVGGYVHSRAQRPGFIRYRTVGLVAGVVPLLVAWAIIGGVLAGVGGKTWADGTVTFALSPLWFLGVYLVLIVVMPLWRRLHEHLGIAALPLLAVLAATVDVLRFGFGADWVGWFNLVLVWGLAHQAGFHYDALMRAPKRVGVALVGAGLAGLAGLTVLGYPGSMVGVTGDKWSNMSPPTMAIVALTVFQIGLIRLAQPGAVRVLATRPAQRILRIASRYQMPVFVFHMSILLLAQAIGWPVTVFVLVVWISWTWLRRHVREVLRR